MRTLSPDTHPDAEAVLIRGLRQMGGEKRLARVFSLRRTVLALARARILQQHGPLPEREIRLRLAALWLDPDTLERVKRRLERDAD
jgi:hypothetical protein